jgi:hypothetical protein
VRGSPIRKSSDQRSVDSSPRLIAASYVLHRLLVPRHPPCALNNLTTHNTHARPPQHPRTPGVNPRSVSDVRGPARISRTILTRCSRPLCSSQSTEDDPPSITASPRSPRAVRRQAGLPQSKQPDPHRGRPTPSGPNSVPTTRPTPPPRSTPSPNFRRSRGQQAVLGAASATWPNWSAFHPRAPSRTPEHPRE